MEPFKNELNYQVARRIGAAVAKVHPAFSLARFSRGLADALDPLELKQRVGLLAGRLAEGLPASPPRMFRILVKALAADDAGNGLRGFAVWPLTEVVARHGLVHIDASMAALAEMTRRFTAEFAIRPFLRTHPDRTLAQMHAWCAHPDEAVRRLASEGSRPFLPWGGNLPFLLDPPWPTLGLLEKLYRDPGDSVRLSVANHLNDLSKARPELVLETLVRWRRTAADDSRFNRLARHACRTLIKAGHAGAMEFHGYGASKALVVEACELGASSVALGGHLDYRLVVRNSSRRALRVMFDYAVFHRKANGGLTPKVFKGRTRELLAGESWEITGRHGFKPITTRVYHAGGHVFEPRLNGKAFEGLPFELAISGKR